jgi:hypothetical protein
MKIVLWIATGLSAALLLYVGMLIFGLSTSHVLSASVQWTYVAACVLVALSCILGPILAWRSFRQRQFKRSIVFAALPVAMLAGAVAAHALSFGGAARPPSLTSRPS